MSSMLTAVTRQDELVSEWLSSSTGPWKELKQEHVSKMNQNNKVVLTRISFLNSRIHKMTLADANQQLSPSVAAGKLQA